MILLAHILMVPVEEVLVPLAGAGAGTAAWLAAFLPPFLRKRRRR